MSAQIHKPSGDVDKHNVDTKAYYVFGRVREAVDIHLDDSSCSRSHAALVHHNDGRVFLIDLQSVGGSA